MRDALLEAHWRLGAVVAPDSLRMIAACAMGGGVEMQGRDGGGRATLAGLDGGVCKVRPLVVG